jgi:uncharacterized BrkB/YihY/UPF0761 family membrane protein
MAWTTSDRVMGWREKSHAFDLFAEMMDGWRRHLSGRNASLLAFFSFLSIFPLMLAAVTILGFVLDGNDQLRQDIIDSAAAEIPVLGPTLEDNSEAISGSWISLIIGLGAALWASTKAFVALHGALDDTWEVDVDDRDGLPVVRGRALLGLLIIATSQVASVAVAGIVDGANLPAAGGLSLTAATFVINIAVLAAMYRLLTSYSASWRNVWPGAIIAGVVVTLLQIFGTRIVIALAGNENDAMGTINSILALLTWLSLIGIAVIMCAELNAARLRLGQGPQLEGAHLDLAIRA